MREPESEVRSSLVTFSRAVSVETRLECFKKLTGVEMDEDRTFQYFWKAADGFEIVQVARV